MSPTYCDDNICIIDEAVIRIRDLSLSYGSIPALQNVSLDVAPCSVTAIIGPSGSGKSSLLNCINRMIDYDQHCKITGTITIDNKNILAKSADTMELRKKVGMIFQKPNPFPVSIRKNITMPLRYHGRRSKSECEALMEKALLEAGLWDEVKDRLDSAAQLLSGGQQQRLCIARAIALEPEVLLMDEPCSALDPNASATIESLVGKLRSKYTVVMVTHNLAQARRISDHTALLWNHRGFGELVEAGPTTQLFAKPKNTTTQAYLAGAVG